MFLSEAIEFIIAEKCCIQNYHPFVTMSHPAKRSRGDVVAMSFCMPQQRRTGTSLRKHPTTC